MRRERFMCAGRRALGVFALGGAFVMTGCFTYHEIPPELLQAGTEVRAGLSEPAIERVSDLTGRPRAVSVEGTVVARDGDGVVFELWRTDRALAQAGPAFRPGRIEVPIAVAEIVSLEEKRLSRLRTGVLAGAAATGLFLLVRAFFSDAGGGVDSPTAGPDIILGPARLPH